LGAAGVGASAHAGRLRDLAPSLLIGWSAAMHAWSDRRY